MIQNLFNRHLFATNVVSCGVLMGLGDLTVQSIERMANTERLSQPIHWNRTLRAASIGVVMGPFNHLWYMYLDKVLPGRDTVTVFKKILADQVVASPFFAFTYFMGIGTLEGQPVTVSWTDFKAKFWTVYKADWTVWPAAQTINFFLLPPQYRVVYVAMVTYGWNTFLSYMKNKESAKDKSKSTAEVSIPGMLQHSKITSTPTSAAGSAHSSPAISSAS